MNLVIIMKIGIYDIDRSSNLTYKERLDIYKECGFNELAIYLDNNYLNESENYDDIIKYANEINLTIKQVHLDYKISNLICSKDSNEYFEYLENKINECIKYNIPMLVVHASKGDEPPTIDNESLEKVKALANKYINYNITICFENVRVNNNLGKILSLNLNNIRMCYDLGHAHIYDNEFDLLKKYSDYIACAHLHNNLGTDSHNRLSQGEIDYKTILKELFNTPIKSACLECFPPRGTTFTKDEFKQFIKECYKDCAL